jgi:hypothetical protein
VQRQIHQAALARLLDITDRGERLRAQAPPFDHAHPARPLREEHATVGRERDGPRHFEVCGHRLDAKLHAPARVARTARSVLRRRYFARAPTGRRLAARRGEQ